MNFELIFNQVKEIIPYPVIAGIIAVIMLMYATLYLLTAIEDYLEAKLNKQIKLFDHKKVLLSLLWSVVVSITLVLSGFIEAKQILFYSLMILGGSTVLYETFLKGIGVTKDDKEDTGSA